LIRYSHPRAYAAFSKVSAVKHRLKNTNAPYRPYFPTVRDYESNLLAGHALRMRIEYSAVLARSLGFEYGYPLLHPPLVDFCLALPPSQKRRHGQGRYLVRRYLATHLDAGMAEKEKKGGGIMPSTFHHCKVALDQGKFDADFRDLPLHSAIKKQGNPRETLKGSLAAYMLKHYLQTLTT
jgi:hypothetical protein